MTFHPWVDYRGDDSCQAYHHYGHLDHRDQVQGELVVVVAETSISTWTSMILTDCSGETVSENTAGFGHTRSSPSHYLHDSHVAVVIYLDLAAVIPVGLEEEILVWP